MNNMHSYSKISSLRLLLNFVTTNLNTGHHNLNTIQLFPLVSCVYNNVTAYALRAYHSYLHCLGCPSYKGPHFRS